MQIKNLPRSTNYSFLAMLIATGIWGVATVVIKITLEQIPLLTTLFFRFLIVCIVLLPFIILELKKRPVNTKDLPTLFILGILGQTAILIVFYGIRLTSTIDASILGATGPLIVIGLGHYYFKDRLTRVIKWGLILATVGTLLVILEPTLSNEEIYSKLLRISGNILILLYNVIFAYYLILSKKVMGKNSLNVSKTLSLFKLKPLTKPYSPFTHTVLSFYAALITFIPLYILEVTGVFGEYNFNILHVDLKGFVGLIYLALFSSIVAYLLFQWGLEKSQVSDSGIVSYLGPAFTIPTAFIILGEIPTSSAIVGIIIISIGVLIAETQKS